MNDFKSLDEQQTGMDFKQINPQTYEGTVPTGYDLVIAEEGHILESALILYGFDEINLFKNDFTNPIYGFLKDI
jgi:hypothetical protein